MKDSSVEVWLAALQERLNEDVRSRLPSLDKESLAMKLTELLHQVRGPCDSPLGMKAHRLELSVVRRKSRRYSGGRWIVTNELVDYFELRVTTERWDVIMSMEARMDDYVAMTRMFQFIKNTRVSVLTLQFDEKIYTGKLRDPILQVLEQKQLKCVEICGGANVPDVLLDFAAMVARNKRRCYFKSLSIMGHCDARASLPNSSARKISAMLHHFELTVLTLDGVCIADEMTANTLADGIHSCQTLESLNLSVVNLNVQPIIGLCILQNESLMHLKLSAPTRVGTI